MSDNDYDYKFSDREDQYSAADTLTTGPVSMVQTSSMRVEGGMARRMIKTSMRVMLLTTTVPYSCNLLYKCALSTSLVPWLKFVKFARLL